MPRATRILSATIFLAALWLGAAGEAWADSFVLNIPDYVGPSSAGPFPGAPQTVGTFNFTIPAGHSITRVSFTGAFVVAGGQRTSAIDVFVDGQRVVRCLPTDPCSEPGVSSFSQPFVVFTDIFTGPRNFPLLHLSDGSLTVSLVQTGVGTPRLYDLRLFIQTAATPQIPEPTTIALLGTGLLGVLGAARRRRKS